MGLLTHLDLEVDDFVDDFDLEAVFLEPFEAALAGPRETDRRGRGGGGGINSASVASRRAFLAVFFFEAAAFPDFTRFLFL